LPPFTANEFQIHIYIISNFYIEVILRIMFFFVKDDVFQNVSI